MECDCSCAAPRRAAACGRGTACRHGPGGPASRQPRGRPLGQRAPEPRAARPSTAPTPDPERRVVRTARARLATPHPTPPGLRGCLKGGGAWRGLAWPEVWDIQVNSRSSRSLFSPPPAKQPSRPRTRADSAPAWRLAAPPLSSRFGLGMKAGSWRASRAEGGRGRRVAGRGGAFRFSPPLGTARPQAASPPPCRYWSHAGRGPV